MAFTNIRYDKQDHELAEKQMREIAKQEQAKECLRRLY
jgi:hypothetical protein